MITRVLTLLLALLFVAALLLLVIPWILFFTTAPFAGNLAYTLCFVAIAAEKIWAMFFRMRQRFAPDVERDWTTVTVGYAFAAVMYFTLIEYFAGRANVPPAATVAGLAVYAAAVLLRYWAFHRLKHQWAIHVDKQIRDRSLITDGPYRYIRHPLYAGACLETIGLPLAFASFWTLLFAVVVFIPLEVQRAYFEERFLRQIFGSEYEEYVRRTWAFLPLPGGKGRSRGPADKGVG